MILNRAEGFGVGPTVNPHTKVRIINIKGLWIWGWPVTGFTSDGESIQVLVIDSEGLGALN